MALTETLIGKYPCWASIFLDSNGCLKSTSPLKHHQYLITDIWKVELLGIYIGPILNKKVV